jgi:hypothetical protein
LKVYFGKSLIFQQLLGIFQKKIVDFDEFYSFLIPGFWKNLEIYPKKLKNMAVLVFIPSISGESRGDRAKWL